jgi:DNA-binding NarL/FixJ family response regulator
MTTIAESPDEIQMLTPERASIIKVAVVEDSDTLRRNLKRWLNQNAGFKCVGTCANGAEALKQLPPWGPDVVLMDIQMPEMSGVECSKQLKRLLPKLQIMVLTVYEDTDTIFKALRAGASGYLLKRSPLPTVGDAIRELRAGGAPMTSEIARKVVEAFQEKTEAATQCAEETLTVREQEILCLLTEGLSNKEIAARLDISPWTVKIHLGHIFEKLHVRCRVEAVRSYMKQSGAAGPASK